MNLALILFVISIAVTAGAVSTWIWRRFATVPPARCELWASVAVSGFTIAIAISWLLSWFRLLDRGPLLIVAIALAVCSAFYLHRFGTIHEESPFRFPRWALLTLIPLVLWIAFVLWRGSVVPALSHDALAYHMPKAVMLARAHGYAFFDAPDPRIGTSPANYELLLADILLLSGSDAYTEWLGTASYIALLLLAAALAQRWWGTGPHLAVVVLLTAAAPVILLHAGAHKNDLLANVFYLGALLWGGRWLTSQETAPLLLMLASGAAAAGTKLQAAFPIAALVAVALVLLVRRRLRFDRMQAFTLVLAVGLAVLLLGGWVYVSNYLHTRQVALPASSTSDAGYGDWSNLLEVPALMLMRPFDPSEGDLYVPWRGERWFWPRFELYFSDFGSLVTILVLLLPWTVRRYVGRGAGTVRRERVLTSIAALLAFLLMLPIRIRPFGFFAGFPRYFGFIAIFVLLWTIAPLVRELALRRKPAVVQGIGWASAAILTSFALNYTINDPFQPLSYVLYVAEHPGFRLPNWSTYRAATIVDQIAGPRDTVAVQAGFDSWIYPIYGQALQRKVVFIDTQTPIPSEARFVIVDRAWNILWGDPRFENTGQYKKYLTYGKPSEEDVTLIRRLYADRKNYKLVYYFRPRNQAVFRRLSSAPQPPRAAVPNAGSSH